MLKVKSILIFGIKCFLIYSLLLVTGIYTNVGEKYANIFRSTGNSIFKEKGESGKVRFQKIIDEKYDTKIKVTNFKLKKKGWYGVPMNTWRIGYLPTIILISLVLATSFATIRKKLIAFLLGVLMINVYIIFTLDIKIRFVFNEGERFLDQFTPSFTSKIVALINYSIIENIGLIMIVPVFIWLMVTFERNDFKNFVERSL